MPTKVHSISIPDGHGYKDQKYEKDTRAPISVPGGDGAAWPGQMAAESAHESEMAKNRIRVAGKDVPDSDYMNEVGKQGLASQATQMRKTADEQGQ